jgi:anti-sigma factor RsiW
MRQSRKHRAAAPALEELTAYVDERLDPALRPEVEMWLRNHPEAAAEIDGQRGLARLWQATAATEPSDRSWRAALAHVEAASFPLPRNPVPRRRRIGMSVAGGLAAALLFMFCWPHADRSAKKNEAPEPLAVASPEDVEIVSLRAADRATLVVGVPPVTEPLVLVSVGDVEFERVEPAADGMVPYIQMDEGAAPLVLAPLDRATERTADKLRK